MFKLNKFLKIKYFLSYTTHPPHPSVFYDKRGVKMAKRGALNVLTRDNWDNEEDDEEVTRNLSIEFTLGLLLFVARY